MMCGAGHKECLNKANKKLNEWKQNPSKNDINKNLRSQIYCYGIKGGDVEMWNFMYDMYKSETLEAEKKRLLRSLACSNRGWILNRLLEESLENDAIRNQDTTSVIQWVASNDVGSPIAWDFIRENWEVLMERFGGGSFSFSRLILAVTNGFSTEYKKSELIAFKESKSNLGSAALAFDQAVEKANNNINWLKQNEEIVSKWLQDRYP